MFTVCTDEKYIIVTMRMNVYQKIFAAPNPDVKISVQNSLE